MLRKLSFATIALLAALFVLIPDVSNGADSAPLPAVTNNKLLISPLESTRVFEQGMKEAGWDVHRPVNKSYYNVRQIIRRQEIEAITTDWTKRNRKAIEQSA